MVVPANSVQTLNRDLGQPPPRRIVHDIPNGLPWCVANVATARFVQTARSMRQLVCNVLIVYAVIRNVHQWHQCLVRHCAAANQLSR
jgi:hypothetical protein